MIAVGSMREKTARQGTALQLILKRKAIECLKARIISWIRQNDSYVRMYNSIVGRSKVVPGASWAEFLLVATLLVI